MTPSRRAWLLGAGALSLTGCAGWWGGRAAPGGAPDPEPSAPGPAVPGVHTLEETVEGYPRRALLFVPEGVKVPAPVVMGIHGSKDSPEAFLGSWREALASRGWVGLFPSTGHAGKPVLDGSGDTPFMVRLLDRVAEEHPVDAEQVYVAGFSGGARETYRLASRHGRRLAAIGAAAGVVAYAEDPPGGSDPRVHGVGPLSVIHIHGKRDAKVRLQGGVHRAADGSEHRMLPTLEGMQRWIALDRGEEQARAPVGYGPSRLRARRWVGPSGHQVWLVVDPELGHAWPRYGAELMARFFEAQPRRTDPAG